jgi:hypothetical protein
MSKINAFKEPAMPFTISGDWTMRSTELKREFPELTDGDVLFERGREEELISRIADRLNKNREEVIGIIKGVRQEGL